jgi:hypothetical protein
VLQYISFIEFSQTELTFHYFSKFFKTFQKSAQCPKFSLTPRLQAVLINNRQNRNTGTDSIQLFWYKKSVEFRDAKDVKTLELRVYELTELWFV